MTSLLRAGAARVRLDPPLGVAMMGYGLREGVAREHHDPLHARALFLGGAGGEQAGELLLVLLDVCLFAPAQADAARERIARETGVARERVLLGAIHTHSGPDTGLGQLLAGRPPPAHVAPLFDAAVEAAVRARRAARPAALGVGRAEARIGRNRRRADGPLDPEVLVVRVDRADAGGGGPLAVLFVHGCHPTVLGHENLAYSADWPGVAVRAVEDAHPGAVALFALGAHADVDPRTRGVMDLAVEGQSAGAGFDAVEALGGELGRAVADAVGGIPTDPAAPVGAAAARREIPVHGAEAGEAERERALAEGRRAALAALGLPTDSSLGTAQLFGLVGERTRGLPDEERRERSARARLYLRDRTAARFAGGARPAVEAQVLRLGDAWLLGLPAEPTVDVGLDWKARRRGGPAAVLGIANGWLRYLPHPDNFGEPDAHRHYEVLMSTFVPDAAGRLLDAGDELVASLAEGGA